MISCSSMFVMYLTHGLEHRQVLDERLSAKMGAQLGAPILLDNYIMSVYATLTASTSMLILMSFPTTTPPVSRAWFQVSPNSRRSILLVALNPTR